MTLGLAIRKIQLKSQYLLAEVSVSPWELPGR